MIARSNGIPPLIELVTNGSQATQEAAACLLWHLAGNPESGTAIAAAGGIQPLCTMLSAEEAHAQELGATVISRLLRSNTNASASFTENSSGIGALVKMLNYVPNVSGSAAGQQQAACALAEVARMPDNRAIIADAGGIDMLVSVLMTEKSLVGTPETAARVLGNLARDFEHAGGDASSTAPRDSKAEALQKAGAARRLQIANAGGIKKLITLLSQVSLSSAVIAKKMADVVAKVIGTAGDKASTDGSSSNVSPDLKREKTTQRLSAPAEPSSGSDDTVLGVQEQAAATLADFAYGDSAMQHAIVESGGVPPLLALLRSGSQAQEHAAHAIWTLCAATENQRMIVESGVITDLVSISKSGSARAQEFAAAVMSELANGAIVERERVAAEGEEVDQKDDRLAAIAAGIVPLVSLVSAGNAMCKEHAAKALWHLSCERANRDAIARAGGIPPLVQLLDDGTTKAHEHAVIALNSIAAEAPEHQTQIAKKLVTLLAYQNEGARSRAAAVLANLARENSGASVRIVNAGAISPLVALLGTGSPEAKEEAVSALSCLAENDESNQLAIATGLVALLGLGQAEAQERLKVMVADFAKATDMRTAIAEAGAFAIGDGAGRIAALGDDDSSKREKKSARKTSRKKSEATLAVAAAAPASEPIAPAAPAAAEPKAEISPSPAKSTGKRPAVSLGNGNSTPPSSARTGSNRTKSSTSKKGSGSSRGKSKS